ncbi:MAG: HlyC/CorC family transporter [Proteobacteria bacterium]|nr:HlyC/CorC family transporter [Pseudomonadota bacterium]
MNSGKRNGAELGVHKTVFTRLKSFLRQRRLWTNGEVSLRASLEEVIEEHEEEDQEDTLGDEERSMLMNVLSYGDLRIDDIMVPRTDIVAVDLNEGLENLMTTIAAEAHSRIPVYRGSMDNILGMVHVKDLMRYLVRDQQAKEKQEIEGFLRPVISVPPSMKLIDLLRRMRTERTHMAVVIDEFGGTDGLVTIEDLVEQIVGEIEDEHDDDNPPVIIQTDQGSLEMEARLPLEQLEARLGVDFSDVTHEEDIDTVGGLVVALCGCVPPIGDTITDPLGYRYEILDADPRRIKRLRVHLPGDDSEEAE